eukprot:TRINITY_DN47_c2_g1_i6.p1 TRINITY_DN47_c2_g1~~TRINITY_DN47_c2_g1_i6.p1  ORF type:complete len:138 (-),score=12.69 TRINITY_DN47_c2_g1_i6:161-574(-)
MFFFEIKNIYHSKSDNLSQRCFFFVKTMFGRTQSEKREKKTIQTKKTHTLTWGGFWFFVWLAKRNKKKHKPLLKRDFLFFFISSFSFRVSFFSFSYFQTNTFQKIQMQLMITRPPTRVISDVTKGILDLFLWPWVSS